MRKARGKINQQHGFFHIENSLRTDAPNFSKDCAIDYRGIMFEEATRTKLQIIFWHFHPRGFGLILHKSSTEAEETTSTNQPSDFIKILKQRISAHHNRRHQNSGSIWKDRAKVFHLPNTVNARADVAAYIMARPKIESGKDALDWPSTAQEARDGDSRARSAVKHLLDKERFRETDIQRLIEKRTLMLNDYQEYSSIPQRGRKSEWRPECEQGENANEKVEPPGPRDYVNQRTLARKKFFRMLDRYKAFCEKTGYNRLPRGQPGEDELRAWAAGRRGAYRSGRMLQWQKEALAGTTVLEPLRSEKTPAPPSATWMHRYNELKVFHGAHGHVRLKRRDIKNKTLANWVRTQRAIARSGKLHPRKRQLLDELDFLWEPRRASKK